MLLALTLASCSDVGNRKDVKENNRAGSQTYTCPMHPQVLSDKPGKCPVCGMALVRKTEEQATVTEDISRLTKPHDEAVISSIETIKVEFKTRQPIVQAQGTVTYDTRNVYTIPARFGGRLERVYLKYVFQPVQKGQKIAEIYSPDLIIAQRELRYLLENDAQNTALIESARKKLALLGASRSQIENLVRRKEVSKTFTVYSPYNGFLIPEDQSGSSTPATFGPPDGTDGGMSSPARAASTPSMADTRDAFVREGAYVSTGQTLFKVVNASSLRIELGIPVSEGARIKVGDDVSLDFGDGVARNTSVDFVQPFFGKNDELLKIRVYARDTLNLRIGQLVRAVIHLKQIEALWVPASAVLDLGLHRIVFVKQREVFQPIKVVAGVRAGEWIEIRHGISPSDEIAANAHYLVDSESFVRDQKLEIRN